MGLSWPALWGGAGGLAAPDGPTGSDAASTVRHRLLSVAATATSGSSTDTDRQDWERCKSIRLPSVMISIGHVING
ncbi:hypothetical protein VTN00DRAFT_1155 [Thermoascus crustaceus]|uniref:uncharacterized protein n=1 Tax=Thermoascus crustaceus TaxID=5088 RepID=UPI003742D5C3